MQHLGLMSGKLTHILLAVAVTAAAAQPVIAGHTCSVSDAYEFSHGLENAGDCSILELQNSITLMSRSFSVPSLTVNSLNLTIQPSEKASGVILNFGSYTLIGKVLVTGLSNITFRDISLRRYTSSTVQNSTLNTFLPLFSVDTTSSVYTSNVSFLVDTARCSMEARCAKQLATPRTSW